MAQTVCVIVGADDRARLAAIISDRSRRLKHVQRARIVLLSAEQLPVLEIARQIGISRPAVWRWQQRYGEEGVDGLLRDKTRPPGKPPLPPATVAKVLALTDGYAPQILKNDTPDPYNFRIYNTNIEFGPPLIKWIKENVPEIKKIGLLAPDDAVGQSVAGPLAEDYRKQGFEVVLDLFERGTKEFTPLILRMMAQKVDAFEFDGNSPGDAGLMLKQIRQAGFRGNVMQVGGPAIDEIMEIAGPAAEGFLSYDIFDWDTPAGVRLRAAYEKKYGKGIINVFMPAFYHAVLLLAESIKRADSIETDKVRTALETTGGYDAGVYGPIKWTGKESYGVNRQMMIPYYMSQVKGGKIVKRAKFTP